MSEGAPNSPKWKSVKHVVPVYLGIKNNEAAPKENDEVPAMKRRRSMSTSVNLPRNSSNTRVPNSSPKWKSVKQGRACIRRGFYFTWATQRAPNSEKLKVAKQANSKCVCRHVGMPFHMEKLYRRHRTLQSEKVWSTRVCFYHDTF